MNKHVFALEIDIQIPRHIFIIWCMRRRFSAVLIDVGCRFVCNRRILSCYWLLLSMECMLNKLQLEIYMRCESALLFCQ